MKITEPHVTRTVLMTPLLSFTSGVHKYRATVAMAAKFFAVVPNSCESSVWNLLHVTVLAPGILRWLPGFMTNLFNHALRHGRF